MKNLLIKVFNTGLIHFLFGIFSFAIGFLSIFSTWENKNIIENGLTVEVTVLESPDDCSKIRSRTSFCKLQYREKVFIKRTKGKKYCYLVSGKDTVVMYSNENYNKFLFPKEYNPVIFVFGFFMLGLSFWFFKKVLKIYKTN